MSLRFKIMAVVLIPGAVWAGLRLARESGVVAPRAGDGTRVEGRGFEMTRTFVCSTCGFTAPATAEEITRRTAAGQSFPSPDGQVYRCDREGTPTLELRFHVVPKP